MASQPVGYGARALDTGGEDNERAYPTLRAMRLGLVTSGCAP